MTGADIVLSIAIPIAFLVGYLMAAIPRKMYEENLEQRNRMQARFIERLGGSNPPPCTYTEAIGFTAPRLRRSWDRPDGTLPVTGRGHGGVDVQTL